MSSDFTAEMKKNFCERLRLVRTGMGFRQTDIAEKISVLPSAITQYEAGLTFPTSENLALIARALGVSIDYLVGRTDDPRPRKARW